MSQVGSARGVSFLMISCVIESSFTKSHIFLFYSHKLSMWCSGYYIYWLNEYNKVKPILYLRNKIKYIQFNSESKQIACIIYDTYPIQRVKFNEHQVETENILHIEIMKWRWGKQQYFITEAMKIVTI